MFLEKLIQTLGNMANTAKKSIKLIYLNTAKFIFKIEINVKTTENLH